MLSTEPKVQTVIRRADLGDAGAIVAMGGRFLDSSTYSGKIKDCPDVRLRLVTGLINATDGVILVADTKDDPGHLVGFLALFAYSHPMSGQRFCCEVAWWVEPHARGMTGVSLLLEGERWAKSQGCEVMQMIAPTREVEVLYERKGYVPVERHYQRAL